MKAVIDVAINNRGYWVWTVKWDYSRSEIANGVSPPSNGSDYEFREETALRKAEVFARNQYKGWQSRQSPPKQKVLDFGDKVVEPQDNEIKSDPELIGTETKSHKKWWSKV